MCSNFDIVNFLNYCYYYYYYEVVVLAFLKIKTTVVTYETLNFGKIMLSFPKFMSLILQLYKIKKKTTNKLVDWTNGFDISRHTWEKFKAFEIESMLLLQSVFAWPFPENDEMMCRDTKMVFQSKNGVLALNYRPADSLSSKKMPQFKNILIQMIPYRIVKTVELNANRT